MEFVVAIFVVQAVSELQRWLDKSGMCIPELLAPGNELQKSEVSDCPQNASCRSPTTITGYFVLEGTLNPNTPSIGRNTFH